MFLLVGPAVSSHTLNIPTYTPVRTHTTKTTILPSQEELKGYPERSSLSLWQLIVPDNPCAI